MQLGGVARGPFGRQRPPSFVHTVAAGPRARRKGGGEAPPSQSRTIERQWNSRSDEALTTASSTRTEGLSATQPVIWSPSALRAFAVVAENTFTKVTRDRARDDVSDLLVKTSGRWRRGGT